MSTALLMARVVGSLVAVVLLALVAARFARRTSPGRGRGDLRVCERVGLTRDSAAVVLETDGRRLLVGVSPAQISLLADLGPTRPAALEARASTVPGEILPGEILPGEVLLPWQPEFAPEPIAEPAPIAGPAPIAEPALPAQPALPTRRSQREAAAAASRKPGPRIPAPRAESRRVTVPLPRGGGEADVLITHVPLSRRVIRQLEHRRRRLAIPPTQRGTGSVLDPRTWKQGLEALRDLTARRQ
jgi:flagellar biogenesis protein FliO